MLYVYYLYFTDSSVFHCDFVTVYRTYWCISTYSAAQLQDCLINLLTYLLITITLLYSALHRNLDHPQRVAAITVADKLIAADKYVTAANTTVAAVIGSRRARNKPSVRPCNIFDNELRQQTLTVRELISRSCLPAGRGQVWSPAAGAGLYTPRFNRLSSETVPSFELSVSLTCQQWRFCITQKVRPLCNLEKCRPLCNGWTLLAFRELYCVRLVQPHM